MRPDAAKHYLMLASLITCHEIDARNVDVISAHTMQQILRRLIAKGVCVNCALCGQRILKECDLSFDHIVPRSRGGSDSLHNMQPTHHRCNAQKGNTITAADVSISCEFACDTPAQILERQRKRRAQLKEKLKKAAAKSSNK